MSNLWRKISAIGQNESAQKTEIEKQPVKPGDRVIHQASGAHGIVTAVETIGNVLTLSVECTDGRNLRGLDRKEFILAGEEGFTTPPPHQTAAPAPKTEPMPKLEGEISSESILEKLS
jgi:hypothetical protein